jgi:outer membrane biosynthesis protein TonB
MQPRLGMAMSAILHVVVIAMAVLGLPKWLQEPDLAEAAVHVEIITIADESAAPPPEPVIKPEEPEPVQPLPEPVTASVEETVEPLAEPEPIELPEPEALPEPEPLPEIVPEPEPEPIPEVVEVPEPEPEPVPEPEPEPQPEPEPEPQVAVAPKPVDKPEPPPDSKPEQSFENVMESLLIDKSLEEAPAVPAEEPPPTNFDDIMASLDDTNIAPNVSSQVTATVIDAIRRQIEERWLIPAGAADAEALRVTIQLRLAPDGRVITAQIVNSATDAAAGGAFYRTAAESALRAVLYFQDHPLQGLPSDAYDEWRFMELKFDPSKVL